MAQHDQPAQMRYVAQARKLQHGGHRSAGDDDHGPDAARHRGQRGHRALSRAGVAQARQELLVLHRGTGATATGATVEDKESSLVVHTRRAADPHGALAALRAPVTELAERTGLELTPGRFVLELRPPGIDKGSALRGFVAEQRAGSVLFAGDDLGDLPAYAAVEGLRANGIAGVTVCSGSDEVPEVAERADLVVAGPPGVVAFMRALAAAIGSD